jgi:hypothetical protein
VTSDGEPHHQAGDRPVHFGTDEIGKQAIHGLRR